MGMEENYIPRRIPTCSCLTAPLVLDVQDNMEFDWTGFCNDCCNVGHNIVEICIDLSDTIALEMRIYVRS